jgi:hypothetical protein
MVSGAKGDWMSVSAAVKGRLLGRARDEAERAPLPERGKALVALARGGDPEDISRALVASQGKDILRAQLVVHLAKGGKLDEALSYLNTIPKPSLRGFAAQELAFATTKEKPLEIPVDGLPPKYLSNILFHASIKGQTVDPQIILRSRERVSDELERTQVVSQGAALLVLVGRLDEAKRMVDGLPPWAVDEYHCLVVEAYARSGRADDARHYVRGINEDCLRMECFLRHLEHTEDRVTAVLARSLLNLSKVPRGYSLKLAQRTRAVPDLERAEQYVWQELDDNSIYSALSFIELGELLHRPKEADRAREIFKKSADPKDITSALCAGRLAALLLSTQGASAAESFLQDLSGSPKKSALQQIVPGIVRLGDINHALTLTSQLPDIESRVLALVEPIIEKAPERAAPPDGGFQDRTPTPPIAALPSESEERTNLVPIAKKEEPSRASPAAEIRPPEQNRALAELLGGSGPENFEDDSTVNSRRRRSATELREIIDQVAPQTSDGWSRRDVEDPSVAAWEPAVKPEEPTSRKELPKVRDDVWKEPSPKPSTWREPTPDNKPQLSTRGTPVLSSARVSVSQINARTKEPTSRPEYYTRPEPAIEEAKRMIARGDSGLQAEALRFVWALTRDSAALTEAKSACRGQANLLRALGVAVARYGTMQEAKSFALELPDGEERGKVLTEIAKALCKQNNPVGAEAEILYSAHPTARAMILVEIAKHTRAIEHIEDATAITSEVPDTTLRTKLWQEIAVLYALASRPAKALRFGGEASRAEIAKRLGRANRREEAQRYLEIMDDPERRLPGQLALIQPNIEDAFYKKALSLVEAITPAKRQLRAALLLAKASQLGADITRAKQLAEKHIERETVEGAKDLCLLAEVSLEDAAFDGLLSWFSRQRLARPDDTELVRLWAPLLLQRDRSGKALVSAVESMPELGLRSTASEAAARVLANANLQEQALRVMRAASEPTLSAYGLLAVAASLKSEPSPVEYPEPSELFSL